MTARAPSAASIVVDVSSDGVRVPLARRRVAELAHAVLRAERVRPAELSITFVSAERIAELNWAHLRHRGPTDVITFEMGTLGTGTGAAVGDVYISPEVACENARQHGCTARDEIARLVVHGVLHALGYDHPNDETRTTSPMWRRQERLLARHHAATAAPLSSAR